jgi:PST family polysaccharide transporter
MHVKLTAIKDFLFHNRTLRQTAAKNAFWLAAGNILGRLIKAGLIIYVARVLGAAGYGVFSYAVGMAGFFSLFSDIGINGILIREGARNPEKLPDYLGTSLGIKISLLALAVLAVIFVAPYLAVNIPQAVALLPLAALLIAADGLRDLTLSVPRSQERMQTEAAISIFTNLAITVLGVAAIAWRAEPLWLMAGYTLGSITATVAAFWHLRAHFRGWWRRFQRRLVLPILREAVPFGLLGVMAALMLHTDTLMLGWLIPAADAAEALGFYGAAQRPVFVLYAIPGILSATLFPAFARLAKEDRARFRRVLERAVALAFLAALPFVIGGIILRQDLMVLLFGAEYAAAAGAFAVLLLTMLTVFSGNIISNATLAVDAQKIFIWYLAVGASVNAVLNYFLIPSFGIVGCALATIGAQVLANGIIWLKLKSVQNFQTLRHLPRTAGAALLMGGAVLLLDRAGLPALVSVAAGGAIYFGLLYLFKEPLLAYALPARLRRRV